jgi:putative transposase
MKRTTTPRAALAAGIAKVLKRLHYPLDVTLLCVSWYVAHLLSLRDLEEMMAERAIGVDHSTVHRWVIKLLPLFEKAFAKALCDIRPQGASFPRDSRFVRYAGTASARVSSYGSRCQHGCEHPSLVLYRYIVFSTNARW